MALHAKELKPQEELGQVDQEDPDNCKDLEAQEDPLLEGHNKAQDKEYLHRITPTNGLATFHSCSMETELVLMNGWTNCRITSS